MRALFVTNQLKTAFYEAVASRMRAEGAQMFWVSVSNRWTRFLLDKGWPRASILSLPDFGAEWAGPFSPTPEDEARIARIEASAEVGLNNILIMDRGLNKREGLSTRAWAYVAAREIERFVLANDVRFGFGEMTWAPEMFVSEILRAHNCRYFMHHTVRIPSARVAFFEGVFHDGIAELGPILPEHRDIARAAICAVRDRGERPYYFTRNMNPHRLRPHWLDEFRRALTRGEENSFDHTVPSLANRIKGRVVGRALASLSRSNVAFERAPATSDRPFVLVTLHKQPESSVDVMGDSRNNQLECIRALTRLLPFGWEIWVKEHSHALGDRDARWYRELKTLPGLRLIDPYEDTMALIRRASLVASVAGTACLEAAILGVPAITFARMLWRPILLRDDFDPFGTSRAEMRALLAEAERMPRDPARARRVEDFVTSLVANSFEASISDPVSDPACLAQDNIGKAAEATLRLLRSAAAPKALPRAA